MITQETIDEAKNRLIRLYNPVEIYLFGSYAWGCPDEESDLDLLIVVDTCDPKERYRAMTEGHKALSAIRNLGKNIIVLTKREFEELSGDRTRLFHTIRNKGKKIYARA
jgi:uncharacterized protein